MLLVGWTRTGATVPPLDCATLALNPPSWGRLSAARSQSLRVLAGMLPRSPTVPLCAMMFSWQLLIVGVQSKTAARAAGCGEAPPGGALPGQTVSLTLDFDGTTRPFELHVPRLYEPFTEAPLLLMFHGWGGNGAGLMTTMRPQADFSTFIAVAPTGVPENQWSSWNGGGSSDSPGPAGPTCIPGSAGACYDSCFARPQGCDECDWTTCLDDFGFVEALLDFLEASLCVATERIFVGGYSNGGQFAFEVAARLSDRIAAVAPLAGTPHNGFATGPPSGHSVPLMVVHGVNDVVCPANSTEPSVDGW